MSLDRAKNKVPLRDKSKPLSYDAEALLFIRLIVKPNVPKVTKRDWCLIRDVDVHKFSTAYSRIHKETFKRKSVQRKNETTLQKVQRINRRLDKNIIEKQDVEEYIEDIKKAHSVPNKKRKKEDKNGSENGTNEEKIGQNTELFGENAKHSEPEKGQNKKKRTKTKILIMITDIYPFETSFIMKSLPGTMISSIYTRQDGERFKPVLML